LDKLSRKIGFDYKIINIDSNRELNKKFGKKIPVVLLNDVEIASLKISECSLRIALQKEKEKIINSSNL
jgi:hypothetical protein